MSMGSIATARPIKGEHRGDFLRANDAWFMPVVQKTGPDGSLYILDWYDRYHCYQDANRDPAGIDRLKGRLYRVRYKDTPRRVGFDLARSSDDELINLLSSANVYDRDIAQRLLAERASPAVRRGSNRWSSIETAPRTARMHALWARLGSGPLEPSFHARLLEHTDLSFRAWGVRAAGNQGKVDSAIRDRVLKLATDASPDVRLQVAIAARKLKGVDAMRLLLDVQQSSYRDPLIAPIVWQNLLPSIEARQADLVERLGGNRAKPSGLTTLIPRTIERLLEGKETRGASIARLVAATSDDESTALSLDVVLERFRNHSLPPAREEALRNRAQCRSQVDRCRLRIRSMNISQSRRLIAAIRKA